MIVASSSTKQGTRPKLIFVCPRFGVTSEVWLYRQATGMRHFDVRVIAGGRENVERFPMARDRLEISHDSGGPPGTRFRRAWNSLSNFRHGCFSGSAEELTWWQSKLKAERPHVVLCQFGLTGVRLAPIAAALGVPLITHFHGFDISSHVRRIGYRWRLASTLPNMAGCVTVANFQKQRLTSLGAPEERVRVIPCGVPLDQFGSNGCKSLAHCRFVSVGRFVDKKAPHMTLRAFARCAQECPRSELIMIGYGELLPECRQLAGELGVADRTRFLEDQSSEAVRDELAKSHVFVLHCVTGPDGDMEGWPVSIAEACASGLPIISTRHAGIVDQVDDGASGFLVDEHDWQTMAQHMITLAGDAELQARMGAASRAKIESFDVRNQIEKLEQFLLECAERKWPRIGP